MSATLEPLPAASTHPRDALVARLCETNLATYDLATIYISDYHTHTEHGKARCSLISLSSKTVYGRLFR
jgi:hypothetical protein